MRRSRSRRAPAPERHPLSPGPRVRARRRRRRDIPCPWPLRARRSGLHRIVRSGTSITSTRSTSTMCTTTSRTIVRAAFDSGRGHLERKCPQRLVDATILRAGSRGKHSLCASRVNRRAWLRPRSPACSPRRRVPPASRRSVRVKRGGRGFGRVRRTFQERCDGRVAHRPCVPRGAPLHPSPTRRSTVPRRLLARPPPKRGWLGRRWLGWRWLGWRNWLGWRATGSPCANGSVGQPARVAQLARLARQRGWRTTGPAGCARPPSCRRNAERRPSKRGPPNRATTIRARATIRPLAAQSGSSRIG